MPRLIKPVVSPRGRVIVLTGATLWLIAAMLLSATPDGANAAARTFRGTSVEYSFDRIEGVPGMLAFPGVYTDDRGLVYLTNRGRKNVIRLTPDGVHADVVFGREGAGPGELMKPRSVAVDGDGNVFVADGRLGRLLKYAADGTFVRSVDTPRISSVLIDSMGRPIVLLNARHEWLRRYTNDLDADVVLMEKHAESRESWFGVLAAIGPDDRLFVLDQADLTVRVYDREMSQIDSWSVQPPRLRESIDIQMTTPQPDGRQVLGIDGIVSMSLDPAGKHLVMSYYVVTVAAPEIRETSVAWYHVDGTLELVEPRGDVPVLKTAFLPTGTLLEGHPEGVSVRVPTITTEAEVENN